MRSPTLKYPSHKWRNDHGGAMVEFAIVLPLLLIFVFGIIEFSLLFYNKAVLTNASREGARAAIRLFHDSTTTPPTDYFPTDDMIETVVTNYLWPDKTKNPRLVTFAAETPSLDEMQVNVIPAEGSRISPNCDPDNETPVIVTVIYKYKFLVISSLIKNLPGVEDGGLTLHGATTMNLECANTSP